MAKARALFFVLWYKFQKTHTHRFHFRLAEAHSVRRVKKGRPSETFWKDAFFRYKRYLHDQGAAIGLQKQQDLFFHTGFYIDINQQPITGVGLA